MFSRTAVRFSIALALLITASGSGATECVVLLHGLARTSASMQNIASALRQAGYKISNVDYPSRKHPVEELAPLAVEHGLAECADAQRVHFVTHSLGGILVRHYLKYREVPTLGRVVMIAPPNQGSEVVDALRDVPGYTLLNGPAGLQLGTDADSVPIQLGPVGFELGVIAGTRTFNPILSLYLPNPDDGKVSVTSTKVEGMRDFVAVPHSHPFIMRSTTVIELVIGFIKNGYFVKEAVE